MAVKSISNEFLVSVGASAPGTDVSVAGQDNGSFIAVWTGPFVPAEEPEPEFETEIFARIFNLDQAVGDPFEVNTIRRDPQFDPAAGARPDGSFVVAYVSGEEDAVDPFLAAQIVGADGSLIGPELDLEGSVYSRDADVAVFDDGGFAAIAQDEYGARGRIVDASGTVTFDNLRFGYDGTGAEVAIAALGNDAIIGVWSGLEEDPFETGEENPVEINGIYAQVIGRDGVAADPFLVTATSDLGSFNAAPIARRLENGQVVLSWSLPSSTMVDGDDVFAAIVDPASGTVVVDPFLVHTAATGDQYFPALAVLDSGMIVAAWADFAPAADDPSGSAIRARMFEADGTPQGDAFLVNQVTTGSQFQPSVSDIGDGRFVVGWTDNSGIKARLFDTADAPTSSLYTRAGTEDGSNPGTQVLGGTAGPNSFYFDIDAISGRDRITGFGSDDLLLTNRALPDGNGDGIIGFGRNGILDLDGTGGSPDSVRIDGVSAVRSLGTRDGLFVYADASVRPEGAIEGRIGNDTIEGDAAGTVDQTFFLDTALGIALGNDTILSFGPGDRLVTTSALPDSNNDGLIGFGRDVVLNLASGNLTIRGLGGQRVNALELDASYVEDGVQYFAYSLVDGAG